jgi:NO-binding membrane sensor protein with MHYT domain
MLRVIYACIVEQHDLRLVVLAGLLCLFSCFTAANLFLHAAEARGRPRHLWHIAAAIVLGAGVWATHFVAELAYDPGIPVGYDIGLTGLSIVIAMGVTWLGMAVALRYKANEIGGAMIGAAVGGMHYVGMAALRLPADLHWNFSYVGLCMFSHSVRDCVTASRPRCSSCSRSSGSISRGWRRSCSNSILLSTFRGR